MNSNRSLPIPIDRYPQLAAAALDIRHYADLWNLAESTALQRAQDNREPLPAEVALDARLEGERREQVAALETVRATANDFPESFNIAVVTSFESGDLDEDAVQRFAKAAGIIDGDYSGATIAACDRAISLLRAPASDDTNEPPPVRGGESLGCDLIVVAGMACGATCIMGCGPCCIGGAGAAIAYVAFC